MDNKRTEGLAHEVKGSVKETTGKLTGNRSQQLEGNLEKNAGKIERSVGRAQDDVRS
ncbi:MAG: CsbD family protein, partial [Lysobacter sp.]